MAQYSTRSSAPRDLTEERIASPIPLGLSVLALTTAILGSWYAGFILPFGNQGALRAIGPILLVGGVVQILAGMWEFRKGSMEAATLFTSYGGFLTALGVIFMPGFGILASMSTGVQHLLLGLFYLCWAILLAVTLVGSLRMNMVYLATIGLLFLAYLCLAIGHLTGFNRVWLGIGGWLAIICALVAWYAAVASMLRTSAGITLPTGGRGPVAVE
ncbi:acetate uptake transporter [Ktedonobacter racemifer]|uniref:GPR1/FUN34/yaaH family protein n=1 Tax=Ktedonobacter racemifer DSM 44963 TaxID=485913 RepID=D6TR34_KTERA|nr:GPR1/FUN34/YaaH family transporter [Ktedonobacter racemifer]EFH85905.1 GPR1/FUN34/yaaH family protein [Ktedonobacter racemifer DSM 44963]